MSSVPPSHQRVPTLTEVVLVAPKPVRPTAPAPEPPGASLASAVPASSASSAPFDEAAVSQRVLQDVQRQIDLMLEYRLRDALAPVLARLSEALVREARDELASTLREMVARAVAQEIARHRAR